MATYEENWTQAALAFGGRLLDETGIRDVIDEVATLGDDGNSVTDWLRYSKDLVQQTVDIPFQTFVTPVTELSRFAGTNALATVRNNDGKSATSALADWATKGPALQMLQEKDAFYNYLTGGSTPEEREIAPGIFKGPNSGEMLTLANDRMRAAGVPDVFRGALSLGTSIPYEIASAMQGPGRYKNGSYTPPAFDIYADNIGEQVRNSDMKSASIYTELMVELAIDPMNWGAPAIARGISTHGIPLLVKGVTKIGPTPGAASFIGAQDLIDAARTSQIMKRAKQMVPGRGLLDQKALLTASRSRQLAEWFANNGDINKARRMISDYGMAHGKNADALAEMTTLLKTPEHEMHLFNAMAYRSTESIGILRAATVADTPLQQNLEELLGTSDNIFEQGLVDFPNGAEIPVDHILRASAPEFMDSLLKTHPEIQVKWDALAEEAQKAAISTFADNALARNKGLLTVDNMFAPNRVDQMLEAIPTNVTKAIKGVEKASKGDFFARHTTLAHVVPGGSYRLRPSFIFMAKPGLTFPLHGIDAVERFDGLIEYGDGLIGTNAWSDVARNIPIVGSRTTRTFGNRLPDGYRFANDPHVQDLRAAFIDAGAISKNPEQIRAEIVNQLQEYALSKIAQSSGMDSEIATMLAQAGMSKSQTMMKSMVDSQQGYMTMVHENGLATVLVNHPATVRQTANFIPIMDWAGIRKALHSPVARALVNRDDLASVVTKDEFMRPMADYKGTLTGNRGLRRFGRTVSGRPTAAGGVATAFHAIVDISDYVNNLFKASVLLRLGYPVRNIGEGSLAAAGSGVGWLNVMKEAHLETLLMNTMSNWATMPARKIDRVATWAGYRRNEVMLNEALRRLEHDLAISGDQLKSFLYTVSSPETTRALVAKLADESVSAAEKAAAREALTQLTAMKKRLAVLLEEGDIPHSALKREADGALRLFHADTTGTLKMRDNALFGDIPELASDLSRPISMTPYSEIAKAQLDNLWMPAFEPPSGAKDLPAQWAVRPFSKGPRAKYTAEKQWQIAQDQLAFLRKTHEVRMRQNQNAPWTTYRKGKYIAGTSEKVEFRIRPKSADDQPKMLATDTWGREVDLTNPAAKQSLIDNYTNVDDELITAALSGDRAMQERLSNALAEDGIYRIVLPDSDEWGKVNVIVHPKGIGGRGLRNAVKTDIDAQVAERVAEMGAATVDEALPRGFGKSTVALMNRGHAHPRLGEPVHPRYSTDLPSVLKNGNFESIMDDAISHHATLTRKRDALKVAYQDRMRQVGKISKKRGMAPSTNYFNSRYGDAYVTDSLLSGFDGYAYRSFASNDMTTAYTFGGSVHRADLANDLRYSYLTPKIIEPGDPHYFNGLANLLGRYYADLPGMEDVLRRGGQLTLDNIDPIVRKALENGDRQRLYEEAVEWALGSTEGRQWMSTMGLSLDPRYSRVTAPADTAIAIEEGAAAAARRGTPNLPARKVGEAKRTITGDRKAVSWREGEPGTLYVSDVDIADLIAAQFNFVDNFMLPNPGVRDLFLQGKASAENLSKLFDEAPWELHPFHGALSPTSAEYRAMKAAESGTRNAANELSAKITDSMSRALRAIGSQPETRLLRHPMFEAVGRVDLQQRITFAEASQGRALSVEEINELRGLSQQFALKKIKETLYTLESRSTMDDYMRFVSPFFPAYVNAASRWGRFYLRNPGDVAKVGKIAVVTKPLFTDANGEAVEADNIRGGMDTYMILPVGVGDIDWIDKMWPGAREAMNKTFIPLRSFDWVFQGDPFNPGFGPWVTVPTQELLTWKDEWYKNPLTKWVVDKILPVGPANTGNRVGDAVQQFLPSGVRRIWDKATTDEAYMATYNKMYMTLFTKLQEGTYTGDPKKIADEAHRLTDLMQNVKIASALFSPLALQERGDFEWYSAKFREIRDNVGGDTDLAESIFLEMFPDQFIYTQGSTANLTGGASQPNVTTNQEKYKKSQALAAELGDSQLLWFQDNYMPDGTLDAFATDDFSPYSRRAQFYSNPEGFSEPYRDPKTAQEIIRNGIVQKGWTQYDKYERMVTGMLVQQGMAEGSYEMDKVKTQMMTAVGRKLAAENPVWGLARNEFNTQKKSSNALYFRELINDPEWLEGKTDPEIHAAIPSIEQYLDTRDMIRNVMEMRQAQNPDAAGSTNALENQELKAILDATALQLSKGSVTFEQWHKRYFRNDVVSTTDVEIGDDGNQP